MKNTQTTASRTRSSLALAIWGGIACTTTTTLTDAAEMRIAGIRPTREGGFVLDLNVAGTESGTFDIFSAQGGLPTTHGRWKLLCADLPALGTPGLSLAVKADDLAGARRGFFSVGRADIDSDRDGIPDAREVRVYGTRHLDADSDGDGMIDGWEVGHGLNPLVDDAGADNDADGFSNLEECVSETNPNDARRTPVCSSRIKGMRVGPGDYYGGPYEGLDTGQVVDLIVSHAVKWGVNRLFVHAAFTTYGVTWAEPTTQYLKTSGGHGKHDFFRRIVAKAHEHGIRVLAYIEPTRIQSVWEARPDWRARDINGNHLEPDDYLLSVFNQDYLSWLDTYLNEILDLGADGIDIAECDIGVWGDDGTYDDAANARFFAEYPDGTLGDDNWVRLRTRAVTEWYARMGRIIKARGREYHVTYVWTARSDGSLVDPNGLSDATGFSFNDMCDLPDESRPHYLQAELIWQDRASKYGTGTFSAEWTEQAATDFVGFVNGRTKAIVHVESTPFTRNYTITPQPEEIETSLHLALGRGDGADIYDHDQLYRLTYDYQNVTTNWAGTMVQRVYTGSN